MAGRQTSERNLTAAFYTIDHAMSALRLEEEAGIQGYRGLKNNGFTCCLNVGLQTLFMTKEFREHVKRLVRWRVSSDGNFIGELDKLFNKLEIEKKAVSAAVIIEILGIDVHKEQDAAELLHAILRKTPGSSELFNVSSTKRACVSCTDEQEDLLSLPVSFKDSPEVKDAVKAHVDQMCGEYQMYCHDCKKTTVWKSETINFPKLLSIQLRRFQMGSQGYSRNVREVIIRPRIKVYSHMYELYAIVNHYVKPDGGGHYYADIKCEDGIWCRFDDETVSKTPGEKIPTLRSRFAYLLVYRRRE